MLLLNFSHPITPTQSAHIRDLADVETLEIWTLPVPTEVEQPLDLLVAAIVDSCALSPDAWKATRFLVRAAERPDVALALVAEIHGRCGYFPPLVVMRQNAASGLDEVRDLVDLQEIHDVAGLR